jgi:hypothetical protein
MFTPPPSPGPDDANRDNMRTAQAHGPPPKSSSPMQSTSSSRLTIPASPSLFPSASPPSPSLPPPTLSPMQLKKQIGRRTKWTVLLIPLVLVLITASSRYLSYYRRPRFLHLTEEESWIPPPPMSPKAAHSGSERLLRHHVVPRQVVDAESKATASSTAGLSFPTSAGTPTTSSPGGTAATAATTTPASAQPLPTVPYAAPTLPTPFPQPIDTLEQNFTSEACYAFFLNMTESADFRTCRPFSLLLDSSNAFLEVSGLTHSAVVQSMN